MCKIDGSSLCWEIRSHCVKCTALSPVKCAKLQETRCSLKLLIYPSTQATPDTSVYHSEVVLIFVACPITTIERFERQTGSGAVSVWSSLYKCPYCLMPVWVWLKLSTITGSTKGKLISSTTFADIFSIIEQNESIKTHYCNFTVCMYRVCKGSMGTECSGCIFSHASFSSSSCYTSSPCLGDTLFGGGSSSRKLQKERMRIRYNTAPLLFSLLLYLFSCCFRFWAWWEHVHTY